MYAWAAQPLRLHLPSLLEFAAAPSIRLVPWHSASLALPRLRQSNVFVEGVSHKIRRQIEDLERAGGVDSGALTVDGVPVDTYLTRSAAN